MVGFQVRARSLVHKWPIFLLHPHTVKGVESALQHFFYQGTNPIHEHPTLMH